MQSSLEINENVDLTESSFDVSYSNYQGLYSKAPINGKIKSNPGKGITINSRNPGTLLTQEKFLIAESRIEFNCDEAWKNAITNKAVGSKINQYVCIKENDIYNNEVYRLYAQEKIEDKKNGLPPGAIAGIVIGVVVFVGLIVFLLVYFLVIKKRKDDGNESSDQEADNDNDANEV